MNRISTKLAYPAMVLLMADPVQASANLDVDCQSLFAAGLPMKAVGLSENLPASHQHSLRDLLLPKPQPEPMDIVVRVEAVSVNPVDTKHRKRVAASESNPAVLGWDVAGVVDAVGANVHNFKKGDQVFYAGSIARAGGNSEYHAVDSRLVAQKPKSLNFTEAAALPLTALTAYEGLFEQLQVKAGKTILVIGGAGGVGSMVIQMAKIAGLQVIATASRPESIAWTKRMGADEVLDHTADLNEQLKSQGLSGVDYIFNTANTSQYWSQMAEVIRPFGRICSIVESLEPVDLTAMMRKSVTFSWELMFTRSLYETEDISRQSEILHQVAEWVDKGQLIPTLSTSGGAINAENLRQAHLKLESGKSTGKIVLTGWAR